MQSIGELLEKTLLHFEKKEYDEAEKLVDELLAANPDFHRGWFLKGVILEETGRSAEAGKCYDKGGNLFNMWFRLALQLEESDPERALSYYDRVLQGDQKHNMVWLNKGLLYEKMGRTGEAGKCFRNLAPAREILSRIIVPVGFMAFLIGGTIAMFQRGNRTMSLIVAGAAVFCFFWLRRDAGTAVTMFLKKSKYQ